MYRQRLKGGHRVAATQPKPPQSNVGWGFNDNWNWAPTDGGTDPQPLANNANQPQGANNNLQNVPVANIPDNSLYQQNAYPEQFQNQFKPPAQQAAVYSNAAQPVQASNNSDFGWSENWEENWESSEPPQQQSSMSQINSQQAYSSVQPNAPQQTTQPPSSLTPKPTQEQPIAASFAEDWGDDWEDVTDDDNSESTNKPQTVSQQFSASKDPQGIYGSNNLNTMHNGREKNITPVADTWDNDDWGDKEENVSSVFQKCSDYKGTDNAIDQNEQMENFTSFSDSNQGNSFLGFDTGNEQVNQQIGVTSSEYGYNYHQQNTDHLNQLQTTSAIHQQQLFEYQPTSEYQQQPPTSEYQQQPPTSEYQQQPPTSEYQQQPPTSEYQQQPPTSEYQQQPPTSEYQQQPPTSEYQQQPPTSEYQQQPPTSEYQQQPPTSEYQQQPPTSEYQQQPPTSEYQQQPPTSEYQQQPPTSEYQQPPPTSEYQQPPPTSEYQQPPPTSEYQQPPPTSEYQQLPPTSEYQQPPPTSEYQQPPPTSEYQQPPPTSEYQQPPPTSEYQQPPPTSEYQQPPPTSEYQQPPPTSEYQQPPPTSEYQQPPPTSEYQQPPPTSEYQQPTSEYQQPTSEYQQPTSEYQQPTSEYQQPTSEYQQPTSEYQQPTSEYQQPTSEYQQPTSDYQQPTSDYQQPTSDYQQPTSDYQQPTSDYQQPTSDYQQPTSDYQQPTSDYQQPTSDYQQPTSDYQQPTSDYQQLTSDYQQLTSEYQQEQPPTSEYQQEQPPTSEYQQEQPPTSEYQQEQPPTSEYQQEQPPTSEYQQEQPPTSEYQQEQPPTSEYQQEQPPTSEYQQQPPPTSEYQQQPPPTSEYQQQPPPTSEYQQQQPPTSEYQQQQPPTSEYQQQQPPTSEYQQQQPPTSDYQQQQPPTSDYQQQQPPTSDYQQPTSDYQQQLSPTSEYQQSTSDYQQKQPPPASENQENQQTLPDAAVSMSADTFGWDDDNWDTESSNKLQENVTNSSQKVELSGDVNSGVKVVKTNRPLGNIQHLEAREGSPFQPPQANTLPSNVLLQNSASKATGIKLAVSATKPLEMPQPNVVPLVVASVINGGNKREISHSGDGSESGADGAPLAHQSNVPPKPKTPKVRSLSSMPSTPQTPTVLDLTQKTGRPFQSNMQEERCENEGESDCEGVPPFSRMVPGCGSFAGGSQPVGAPSAPPMMPSDRVVTGIDNPIAPPKIQGAPSPQLTNSANVTSDQRKGMHPPKRSATIGSEDSATVNAPNKNISSTPPVTQTSTAVVKKTKERHISTASTSSVSPPQSPVFEDGSLQRVKRRSEYKTSSDDGRSKHQQGYRDEMARYGDTTYNKEAKSKQRRRKYSDEKAYRDRYAGGSRTSSLDGEGDPYYRYNKDDDRVRGERRKSAEHYDEETHEAGAAVGDSEERHPRRSSGSGEGRRGVSEEENRSQDEDPRRAEYERRRRRKAKERGEYERRRGEHERGRGEYDRSRGNYDRSRGGDYERRQGREYERSRGGYEDSDWELNSRGEWNDYHRSYRNDYYNNRGYAGYPDQYAAAGHRGAGDYYDPNYYYYYCKKYYENNPQYREYFKQYSQQFPQQLHDDRGSVRSGRSSVNDELKKAALNSSSRALGRQPMYDPYNLYQSGHNVSQHYDASSQYLGDYMERSSIGAFETSAIYPNQEYGQYSERVVSRSPSQRLTPMQFPRPHPAACFSTTGHLVVVGGVDSRQQFSSTVKLVTVRDLLAEDVEVKKELQLIEAFPGPLIREETHKDVVLRFCLLKQQQSSGSSPLSKSQELLWQYLELLVKQNGQLFPSDIARLLVTSANVKEEPEKDSDNDSEKSDEDELVEGVDRIDINAESSKQDNVCLKEISSQLTELVCLGRRKEAIELAVENRLWGHAMAIGSRLEPSMGGRVLSAFLQTLPSDDVMHTLVQQVNGKRPDVTKGYTSTRWGDWRLHLATLVANPASGTSTLHFSKDQAAIIALGDTLLSSGDLNAAHLCYLIGGGVRVWGSKLHLLGTDSSFSVEGIHCSEVYEFGLSLSASESESNELLPGFVTQKMQYALQLTEYGYAHQAVRYCEVISRHICSKACSYPVSEISRLYNLSSALKYSHTHYTLEEGELGDMPDPDWLSTLSIKLHEATLQAASQTLQQEAVDHGTYQRMDSTEVLEQPQPDHNYQQQQPPQPDQNYHHQQQQPPDHTYQANVVEQVVDTVKQEIKQESPVEGVPTQEYNYEPMFMPVAPMDTMQNGVVEAPPPIYSTEPTYGGDGTPRNDYQTMAPEAVNQSPPFSPPQNNHYNDNTPHYSLPPSEPQQEYSADWGYASLPPEQPGGDASAPQSPSHQTPPQSNEDYTKDFSDVMNHSVSLPANDPARKLSLTSRASVRAVINDATRRNLFVGQKSLGNLKSSNDNHLVFGGSYPIDEPVSARNLCKENCGTEKSRTVIGEKITKKAQPSTFQIDGICCLPPNLCEDHSAAASCTTTLTAADAQQLVDRIKSNRIAPSEILPLNDDKFIEQYLKAYYGDGDEEEVVAADESDAECGDTIGEQDQPKDFRQPQTTEYRQKSEYRQNDQDCRRRIPHTYNETPNFSNDVRDNMCKSTQDLTQKDNYGLKRSASTPHANVQKKSDSKPSAEGDGQGGEGEDKNSKGFLSRIFGWKGNNTQAKLPDDKNPSIVWDAERNKWVNTDGTEEEETPLPPPPSMAPTQGGGVRQGGPRRSRYVNPVGEKERVKLNPGFTPPLPFQPKLERNSPIMSQPIQQQPQMGSQPMQQPPQMGGQPPMQQQPQMGGGQPMQPPPQMGGQPIQQLPPMGGQPMQPPQMGGQPMQQQPQAGGPTQPQTGGQASESGEAVEVASSQQSARGRNRIRSDSSSIDLDEYVKAEHQESSGQPMFFNPATFNQSQPASKAPTGRGGRRGTGPQRRSYGGRAPPQ